jgi:hypothetical protein
MLHQFGPHVVTADIASLYPPTSSQSSGHSSFLIDDILGNSAAGLPKPTPIHPATLFLLDIYYKNQLLFNISRRVNSFPPCAANAIDSF